MIDINELRRLAQAATPHVGHACKYQDAHWLREGHVDFENADLFIASGRPQEDADAKFIAAANPATISELLDRLEAAESALSNLGVTPEEAKEGLARHKATLARLEVVEKEYQHVLEVKEIYQRQLNETEDERDELRAMIMVALDVLEDVKGNINPERGYADELEADVERAIAVIVIPSAKGE